MKIISPMTANMRFLYGAKVVCNKKNHISIVLHRLSVCNIEELDVLFETIVLHCTYSHIKNLK